MNFRSLDDMTSVIRRNLHRLPHDIDAVVGIPRSGLVPASVIALHRNVMLTDVEGFVAGRAFAPGTTREKPHLRADPSTWNKVLLVDDSVLSGNTFAKVRERIRAAGTRARIMTCAVFGTRPVHDTVDVVFDVCEQPRIFEWNLFHHEHLSRCCMDIDGVLCVDPLPEENDDGQRYAQFLKSAVPLLVPSVRVGTLVSSRLERYRAETEDWLARHGVLFDELRLLDLASAEERRRLKPYAEFKAAVYKSKPQHHLFIESDLEQAARIAELSHRSVLCVNGMTFFPEGKVVTLQRTLRKKRQSLARLFGWPVASGAAAGTK